MDKEQDALKRKHVFGLLGKDIDYSFSRSYFSKKFENEKLYDHAYVNFDIATISEFPNILTNQNIKGLNVTIPYKEDVIQHLDSLSKNAKKIGAINTIRFTKKGNLKGYNTDWKGFKASIKPHLQKHHRHALILGTGGASKAIAFALKKLGITYMFVSRNPSKAKVISYASLDESLINNHTVIINCTPLGTFPNISEKPDIPYPLLSEKHLLMDLIYNPAESAFLKAGKLQGATTLNGLSMLEFQAEFSWNIWNKA